MKSNAYKGYIRSGMMHNYYVCLENLTTELSNLTRDTKTEYHNKLVAKLVNPSTSAKTYWSISKTFENFHQQEESSSATLISNFKTKTNYFNRSFNQQCTATSTDSSIPSSVNLATNEIVTKINFDEKLISKLVVALNSNKAHGHDGLSIRMLQMGSEPL